MGVRQQCPLFWGDLAPPDPERLHKMSHHNMYSKIVKKLYLYCMYDWKSITCSGSEINDFIIIIIKGRGFYLKIIFSDLHHGAFHQNFSVFAPSKCTEFNKTHLLLEIFKIWLLFKSVLYWRGYGTYTVSENECRTPSKEHHEMRSIWQPKIVASLLL